jgi:membrane protein CcdC involved in cytochrome C biogenesis
VTILLLAPYDSVKVAGTEVFIIGLVVWLGVLITDIRIRRGKENQFRRLYSFNMMLNQIAILPYIISGISLMRGDLNGLYWLLAAMVFSFIKASLDAWVLLIEINR